MIISHSVSRECSPGAGLPAAGPIRAHGHAALRLRILGPLSTARPLVDPRVRHERKRRCLSAKTLGLPTSEQSHIAADIAFTPRDGGRDSFELREGLR